MSIDKNAPVSRIIVDNEELLLAKDEPNLVTKEIIENGTYNATDDNADGYSSVVVNIESSGGGGEEVIVERYTDVTALKNKAIELVNGNRYCCLKITKKKDRTITTTAYKVNATGFVTENVGINLAGTAGSNYLVPIYDNANVPYVAFSNGVQTCTLNASPTYKTTNNYSNANGIVFTEGSEALATLISGGYITVDLCYI